MRRRSNPDGDTFFWLAAAAVAGWYFWNQSQSSGTAAAPATVPITPPQASAIVSGALTAAAAPATVPITPPQASAIVSGALTAAAAPPMTLATNCTGPVGQQTCTSVTNPAWQAYQLANQPPELAPGEVNAGDVLVSGFDANGNPVQVWTGPGTNNPQAGEISGANPGLAQLAQYMGMTTAQTQAWISSQAK